MDPNICVHQPEVGERMFFAVRVSAAQGQAVLPMLVARHFEVKRVAFRHQLGNVTILAANDIVELDHVFQCHLLTFKFPSPSSIASMQLYLLLPFVDHGSIFKICRNLSGVTSTAKLKQVIKTVILDRRSTVHRPLPLAHRLDPGNVLDPPLSRLVRPKRP